MKELREFKTHKEMKDTHQKDVNEFPFIFVFAFADKEFIEKMAEAIKKRKPDCVIETMEDIANQVRGIGAGGYVLHEDYPAMIEMFDRHDREKKLLSKNNKKLKEMILFEMNNHEYGYTRDPYDTLMALGKTHDDLKTDAQFASAWKKAQKKCFADFDKANEMEEQYESEVL